MSAQSTYIPPTPSFVESGKFIVSSSVLLKSMSRLLPVISTNPILPILDYALFQIDSDGLLTIAASNLQQWMSVVMPVEGTGDLRFLAPARELTKLLSMLEEQPITISVSADFKIAIHSDGGYYEFCSENSIDFLKYPVFSPVSQFSLPVATLRSLFRQVMPFQSSDDLRPAMTGVYWEQANGQHELVATDGHRLIKLNPAGIESCSDFSVIIPRAMVGVLARILPEKGGSVTVEIGQGQVSFCWGAFKAFTRKIDERFVDYSGPVSQEMDQFVTLDRTRLMKALRRCLLFADRNTHRLKLTVMPTSHQVTISAENLDYNHRMNESLSARIDGKLLSIGFNAKLLLEVLSTMSSKLIQLQLKQSNRATLIYEYASERIDESALRLVMPVNLNEVE